jgi:serine/threonine protein phosphatase PrpC
MILAGGLSELNVCVKLVNWKLWNTGMERMRRGKMPELFERDARWLSVPDRSDWVESVACRNHPRRNEDCFLIERELGVAAVFDGVGGHEAGERASRIGRDACLEKIGELEEWGLDWPEWALFYARGELISRAREAGNNMTTTAVVARVGEEIEVAWCGDSRAYAIYEDGSLGLLTTDHSLDDYNYRVGMISKERAEEISQILDEVESPEEAYQRGGNLAERSFSARNRVMSVLSEGEISKVVISRDKILAILLTSDGVHDNLPKARLEEVVREGLRAGVNRVANLVVEAADLYAASGNGRSKPDDITAVVLPIQ